MRLAGDVLGCDGDQDEDADGPGSVLPAQQLAAWLERFRVPAVIVRSGRPGHAHLLARPRDPLVLEAAADQARQLGLQVRRDIRPPLAPHRLGLPVSLMSPADSAAALIALAEDQQPQPLPHAMQELLHKGTSGVAAYSSASEAVQAVVVAAAARNWTLDETAQLVLEAGLVSDKHLAQYEQWMEANWTTAVEHVALDRPSGGVRAKLQALRESVQASHWPGAAGSTDERVLLALIEIGLTAMTMRVDAGARTVALKAGVTPNTASASLRRLTHAGWLKRLPPSTNPLHAQRYLLQDPTTGTRPSRPPPPRATAARPAGAGLVPPALAPGADLWRRRGLGASCERVHRFSRDNGPTDKRGIVQGTGRASSTVDRAVLKLIEHRLLRVAQGRYIAALDQEPEQVAERLGVKGQGEEQRQRFADQRRRRTEALQRRQSGR